jgi:integrase
LGVGGAVNNRSPRFEPSLRTVVRPHRQHPSGPPVGWNLVVPTTCKSCRGPGGRRPRRGRPEPTQGRPIRPRASATIAKPPRVEVEPVEPYTLEEIRAILTAAQQGRNAARWAIALALGLRQKSDAGRRIVGLPPVLVQPLAEHKSAQSRERVAARQVGTKRDWVFTSPTGRPLVPNSDYHRWKALLKAAGVRDARLHDACHTAATVLLILGVPERTVMGIMGRSSTSMASRYQHVTDPIRRDVAARVGGPHLGNGTARVRTN